MRRRRDVTVEALWDEAQAITPADAEREHLELLLSFGITPAVAEARARRFRVELEAERRPKRPPTADDLAALEKVRRARILLGVSPAMRRRIVYAGSRRCAYQARRSTGGRRQRFGTRRARANAPPGREPDRPHVARRRVA
jgi:hypothetical protein